MAYSPSYVYSSPSQYLRDDLLADLDSYARDLPPSSTPTLSHGTSSSLEDRMPYTDSPGSRSSLDALADVAEAVRKRQRSDEYGNPPRLSTNGSWYLRSQSDPASYLPSWAVPPAPIDYANLQDERPTKRARVLSLSPPAVPVPSYAREPAALRKARSLRSEGSVPAPRLPIVEQDDEPSDMSISPDSTGVGALYIPTRPSTPAPVLPILPHYVSVPARPDAPEDAAARRLQLLLEKEGRMRHETGLTSRFDRTRHGGVMYGSDAEGEYAYASLDERHEDMVYDTDMNPRLLEGAVEWILTVVPPSNSTSFHKPGTRSYAYSADLHAQLSNGPETSFFAAVLFRTYWVVEAKRARAEVQERRDVVDYGYEAVEGGREVIGEFDGERELAFDFALAAIALAVKFDRDVLRPLRPVFARDFARMAPHEVCFEELESAQWSILRSLNLELNLPMPHALLTELRASSIPLQLLIPSTWMWEIVVDDVWWMSGLAIRQKDFLRYPISLLVITALTESIQRLTALRLSDTECEFCILKEPVDVDELMIGTGTAIEDVRELSGWKEDDVDGCTVWIGGLVGEAERSGRRGVLSPEE
ncbi:hypothetical protein PENSPDRAFT_750192 [Peniophora sp. CONT]|nr:hypothetical protein PENSPDRAFT_750192 [Peniophora sp. CONT]